MEQHSNTYITVISTVTNKVIKSRAAIDKALKSPSLTSMGTRQVSRPVGITYQRRNRRIVKTRIYGNENEQTAHYTRRDNKGLTRAIKGYNGAGT